MSGRKDHRDVLRRAQRAGATVQQRRSGHIRVVLPSGGFVSAASSPSDANAAKALERDLRRAGLDIAP